MYKIKMLTVEEFGKHVEKIVKFAEKKKEKVISLETVPGVSAYVINSCPSFMPFAECDLDQVECLQDYYHYECGIEYTKEQARKKVENKDFGFKVVTEFEFEGRRIAETDHVDFDLRLRYDELVKAMYKDYVDYLKVVIEEIQETGE